MAITIIRRPRAPDDKSYSRPVVAPLLLEEDSPKVLTDGRNGAELKRRMAAGLFNRTQMNRQDTVPRLTKQEELDAVQEFIARKGVTKLPPAFAAETQAAIK